MKRPLFLLLGLAALLFAVGDGRGGPVTPFAEDKAVLGPLTSRLYTVEFKGGQRALVLATGNGATFMGVYVYDAQGNCVAWDDEGNLWTCDDLAVDWTPPANAIYTIEVRNAGLVKNTCRVVMR
jgi:hypothetical protein